MKIFTHIPYNRRDKNRKHKNRLHALIQFDLQPPPPPPPPPDQNTLSFENILCFILNHKKRFDSKLEFFAISLSLFTYSSFY